jgi:hypothetical protein
MQTMQKLVFRALIGGLLLVLPLVAADSELYGPNGVRPEGVRQGKLGSCYFHAVIAAVAQSNPGSFERMIRANPDGTYTVQFADGVKENAYPDDIRYSRDTGYDLSEGLWVAVVFRAYAQRVLRAALVQAIDKSDLYPLVKPYVRDFVASNDPILLAYDRAIRSEVDQYGNVDREQLEANLKEQMKPLGVPDDMKASVIKLLDSGGFFGTMVTMVRQNGEIFGAYRAVGQGGIAERVMLTLAGSVGTLKNESASDVGSVLQQLVSSHRPIVACTAGSQFYQQVAAGQALPAGVENWYVNAHCYTVLGYDGGAGNVTLRNPWARQPDPDGIFSLPLGTFLPAYRGIITSGK